VLLQRSRAREAQLSRRKKPIRTEALPDKRKNRPVIRVKDIDPKALVKGLFLCPDFRLLLTQKSRLFKETAFLLE